MSLLEAKVEFIDQQVNLIYIPLKQYADYLQPILQLLCPKTPHGSAGKNHLGGIENGFDEGTPWSNQHPFLNISINTIECTVMCTKPLAENFFVPAIQRINRINRIHGNNASQAKLAEDDYVVFSVIGPGLDPGQRVLELTSPLAMAGISIFFITTYFSDYILVPARSREEVIRALEKRGFILEKHAATYVNVAGHPHKVSSSSSLEFGSGAGKPPSSAVELEARTFHLLNARGIVPEVNREIRLVHCAGRRDSPGRHSPQDSELHIGLMQCLIHQPRFLSLTLTKTESASLLLQQTALANFRSDEILLGSQGPILIPIVLNLESLPIEAPGIVCGIARMLGKSTTGKAHDDMEISYLSTARTGTVIVEEQHLKKAVNALREGEFGFNMS